MKIRRRGETEQERWDREQRDRREQIDRQNDRARVIMAANERRAQRKAKRAARKAERKAKRTGQQAHRPAPGSLRIPRTVALVAIAVVVGSASLTSLSESYRGLFDWAHEHGLTGTWAAVAPLQVDTFLVVGELALFVAMVDGWNWRQRASAWAVTLAGLAVSIAGNVGHVHGHLLSNRATAAVPPLAAFAALAVGLGVLKRVVGQHHTATAKATSKTTATPDTRTPKRRTAKRTPATTDTSAAILGQPDMPAGQLAAQLGISDRTVRRHRAAANGHEATS